MTNAATLALLAALPVNANVRWTPNRKAAIVDAINGDAITVEEAAARYNICEDELAGWVASIARNGTPGLRVTRIQIYGRAA